MKTLKLIFSFFIFCFLFETFECLEPIFVKIGTYTKANYKKNFFIPRYFRGFWQDANNICRSFGMQLATFETEDEYKFVIERLGKLNELDFDTKYLSLFHIGGIKHKNGWYWIHNGNKINYTMPFINKTCSIDSMPLCRCLTISFKTLYSEAGIFGITDCEAGAYLYDSFMCQTIE